MRGKVIFYKKDLGYGFIRGEDTKEYFFSYHQIVTDGYKICNVDDLVEFTPANTNRGLQAKRIHVLKK